MGSMDEKLNYKYNDVIDWEERTWQIFQMLLQGYIAKWGGSVPSESETRYYLSCAKEIVGAYRKDGEKEEKDVKES